MIANGVTVFIRIPVGVGIHCFFDCFSCTAGCFRDGGINRNQPGIIPNLGKEIGLNKEPDFFENSFAQQVIGGSSKRFMIRVLRRSVVGGNGADYHICAKD